MNSTKQLFCVLTLAFTTIATGFAATRTWTGSANSTWNNASNWNTGVPNSGDNVIIPSGLTNYPVLSANVSLVNFTMNGGSFSSNNFNLTISNNLIINDGFFNGGSGTVSADNVDLNGGWTLIQGNRLNLGNDFTIDGGLFTVTGANLFIGNDFFMLSGYLELSNYNMTVADDFSYAGGAFVDPGSLITTDNFILDFVGGVIDLPTNFRVLNNMDFNNSGIVRTTYSSLLIFGPSATISNESSSRYIYGPARKEITSGGGMTPNFTFPIGDGNVYAPIRISNFNNRQNGDYFTAYYSNTRHPNAGGSLGSGLDHISQAEYWILDRDNNSSTPTTQAEVRLSYDETTRSGDVTDATALAVVRWNGSQWVNHGRGGGSSNNNTSGVTISSSRVTSFSPFTLGSTSSANPLPIKLLDFNAVAGQDLVNVNWTTTSEINNDYFTVEKSTDGKTWSEIGTVKGAGNSEILTSYSFVDRYPVNGVQYYKLKQTDFNGDYTYSKIVPVSFGTVLTLKVFPIPSNNLINVNFDNDASANFDLTISNTIGQVVLTQNGTGNFHQLDISALENGIYFIEVKTELGISKVKFIKN